MTLPLPGWSPFSKVKPLDKTDKSSKTERSRRIIKRYSNRKLYELLQIAGMVRAGEDVQIIDNASKEDKTEVTLALIISEELKSQPRSVPLGTLRDLIHQRGEKLLTQLREGPIGRLIPGALEGKHDDPSAPAGEGQGPDSASRAGEPPPSSEVPSSTTPAADGARAEGGKPEGSPFEHWRHAVDERIRMILPSFIGFRDLQQKIDQLTKRVAELEDELARRKP